MTAPKQLKRSKWPGAILRSLGHASWAAEQTATGITFRGGRHQAPFSSWAGPAQITSTLGFTTIEVPLASGQSAKLAGVPPRDAAGFISAANEAFRAHFLKQFETARDELTALSEVIARLGQPRRYPAACLLSPFLARATSIINTLPETIPDGALSQEQQKLIATVRAFQEHPADARRTAIERFIDSRITEEKISAFAALMRDNIANGAIPFRRAYLRSVIDQVDVDDTEIRIHGRRDVLERLVMGGGATPAGVPSFVRKWRTRQDSNL